MSDQVSPAQASAALPAWRVLLGRLQLTVPTSDFATALEFTNRVGALAEAHRHHPEIDLRWGRVHLALSSHDVGGLSNRDLALASEIDQVVQELGLTPQPNRLREIEIAIDAMDIPSVRRFWAAALGLEPTADGLSDPDKIVPSVWFQQMDQPRPERNRVHLDIWVAHDEAEARVAAALGAGGQLVSAAQAPSFWVLADPEGNEACICTWQDGA